MDAAGELSIGELAGRFGLATSVLRHWEHAGILVPATRVSGRRRYVEEDVYRVAWILLCKDAGLTLDEIAGVLSAPNAAQRRVALERKRAELDQRIEQLTTAKHVIDEAALCGARDPVRCPHFRPLLEARVSTGSESLR